MTTVLTLLVKNLSAFIHLHFLHIVENNAQMSEETMRVYFLEANIC